MKGTTHEPPTNKNTSEPVSADLVNIVSVNI